MSQVKNDKGPIFGLFDAIGKEAGRVVNEGVRHVTESIAEVQKGVQDGGFVGGAVAALDKLSLGTRAVGLLDMIIPGADLPKPLAEGIAGAVNLLTGNPVGFVDMFQAFSAAGGDGGASAPGNTPGGQRCQSAENPRDLWRGGPKKPDKDAIEDAKRRAADDGAAKAERSQTFLDKARAAAEGGGGYAVIDSILDELGDASIFFASDIADLLAMGKANDATKKKIAKMEKESNEAIAQLDKILNNPNLSFEDMIFMLMGALMKQSQKEVKGMTAEVREQKIAADAVKRELAADFDAKEAKVLDLEAKVRKDPKDEGAAKQLGEAKSELRKAGDARSDQISEANDSRQEQLEAIKNAMNKITEMQQTLSNILNSMHQTAMSTIGNIR